MLDAVKPRILLGEDEEDDVVLFRIAMKRAGVSPDLLVLDSGEGVLEYLERLGNPTKRAQAPDIIFLDGQLHHQPSMGFLRWIMTNPTTKEIPVVILTGSLDPSVSAEATSIGAVACFEKPFTPENWSKVQKMIRARKHEH